MPEYVNLARAASRPRTTSRVPELPDVTVYVEALQARIVGQHLLEARLTTPFLLRTVKPPLSALAGTRVTGVSRMAKRIVIAFDDDLRAVIHLMIAGRLHWLSPKKRVPKNIIAAFTFPNGTLTWTEAGTQKRASLHLVRGDDALAMFVRGGLEPLECSRAQFAERARSENHTIKRTLTDQRMFSGIGNAYADEILHRARVSPVKLTSRLTDEEYERLHAATRIVLREWTDRLRAEAGDDFPEKVTAFRPEMVVHGKYNQPCPVCATKVQRIRYASNETNYCPRCQTEGRLLADRGLSKLLGKDWPKRIEDLE